MAFDLILFGSKLRRCRDQLLLQVDEVAIKTGIESTRLNNFEFGTVEPTGDEILILSDFYKQDYHFFISNDQKSSTEQVDILYRKFGSEISKQDRWAIQEFIFLCECEEFVLRAINFEREPFTYSPRGDFYKGHGADGAIALRKFLEFSPNQIITDVYSEMRKVGVHVFRRRLENSSISGLFVMHPFAGRCVLINYHEDVFRQNFTAAHETGHAIFDSNEIINISFERDDKTQLKEVRANAFASEFLVPSASIEKLKNAAFSEDLILEAAIRLRVNPQVLLIALKSKQFITDRQYRDLSHVKIPRHLKEDSELMNLSNKILDAKKNLLERGLSSFYVRHCHQAYSQEQISANRLAEMLLTSTAELPSLLSFFNLQLIYEH